MKKYDIVATIGEYTNKERQLKSIYRNVGELHEKDGKMFILMDKSFNLMAVKQKNANDAKVVLSLYEPKEKDTTGTAAASGADYNAAKNGAGDAGGWDNAAGAFNDSIPF